MGWVFDRPSIAVIEVAWRWLFGIPFLLVCWMQAQQILATLPLESSGFDSIDPQNPWVAAVQFTNMARLYFPHVIGVLRWLAPVAALAWVVVSGLGRSILIRRLDPTMSARIRFRPLTLIVLQAAWLALMGATWWGWFRLIQWVAATHITSVGEPDLVGYSIWMIFLSLGFFTLWALISWPLQIAPLLALLEEHTAVNAILESFKLGKTFSGKLVEINLVMGIVNLALVVLAMVFSAAPLPFIDQLGSDALHVVWILSAVFYLVASDYFQVVRLKGFVEFWKMFRGPAVQ